MTAVLTMGLAWSACRVGRAVAADPAPAAKAPPVADAAALAAPGDPAAAEALSAAIDGVYKSRFGNGLVDGSTFESENILELVAVRPGALYLRTHLEFYNGHICGLSGLATYRRAGGFLLERAALGDGPPCRLQLEVTDQEIRFVDLEHSCRTYYCGARGGFEGDGFKRSARRTIRYLDRLKRSADYREAVGEAEKK